MYTVNDSGHSSMLRKVEKIRDQVDRVPLDPKHERWFQREAFVVTAHASTRIEDATVTPDVIVAAERSLEIVHPATSRYASALDYVQYQAAEEELLIDERLIRHIHWLLKLDPTPGYFRKETNYVERDGIKVYQPPRETEVPILMREFMEALNTQSFHPLVMAAVSHMHLVAIHPFLDGNGRTSRLLEKLILLRRGWGFRSMLSMERYYEENRGAYLDALDSAMNGRFPEIYEADPWIRFFLAALSEEAERLRRRLANWPDTVRRISRLTSEHALLERQGEGLLFATKNSQVTRRQYQDVSGVGEVTAGKDLSGLVEAGLLEPIGDDRHRAYRPTEKAA
ncbi:MAG: Fic family protein [Acidobacteriota bacterium]